ncbi:hypothetical protein BDF20DRAFT_832522 [Mycotypha africana]|uniref:uncharacterized protein n=1 Tax=Mycotypha africana TaxID=64632 RepID=UPI0023016164|nr:uncharacterized protein BDF20DRAFT_832522 [Mycotypha africana]KAI8987609.1 hypothetical protein BDF20DRAFT_832522 [Mycotypha africana]
MDSLVSESSAELANRLSVDTVFSTAVASINKKIEGFSDRVEVKKRQTDEVVVKKDEKLSELLKALIEKQDQLEAVFDQIDRIEGIINKVKETYNAVAENLDSIEKAVSASTTTYSLQSSRRQQQHGVPLQPYFPPPNHVDIFDTNELFPLTEEYILIPETGQQKYIHSFDIRLQ